MAEVYDRVAHPKDVAPTGGVGQRCAGVQIAPWQLVAVQAFSVRGVDPGGTVMLLAALAALAVEVAVYQ